jgi:hypothetical protein
MHEEKTEVNVAASGLARSSEVREQNCMRSTVIKTVDSSVSLSTHLYMWDTNYPYRGGIEGYLYAPALF